MRFISISMYVHVQRLMQYSQELFLHLLVKIISVTQGVDITTKTEYIPMTLSGMAMAVVHEAPVAASTPHRGSASNSSTQPQMTLNSDCVAIRAPVMKVLWLNLLNFTYSKHYEVCQYLPCMHKHYFAIVLTLTIPTVLMYSTHKMYSTTVWVEGTRALCRYGQVVNNLECMYNVIF